MHRVYKLIALSVVFGVVLTSPAAKMTADSFDDLAYANFYNIEDVAEDNVVDESRTVEVVAPKLGLVSTALSLIPKMFGLKTKGIGLAVVLIKWLAPKAIFLAIGAGATLAFCKITNLCSLAYSPAMYNYVPTEVSSLVTPERLEEAQKVLTNALQQYANLNTVINAMSDVE